MGLLGQLVKRGVDIAIAAPALIAAAPLLLAIAAAVRASSPGGALFWQERVGRAGRRFQMVKFRTMIGAPIAFNPDGSTRVAEADPRVTRVGRLLRGGLDELPQLWNVLRGDMSLVGPRPDLPVHAAQYTARERRKLAVRPGMTSLAAVVGRNQIPWRHRIAIDLVYVERWSVALDARIILQTLLLPLGVRACRFDDVVGAVGAVGTHA
jgi:lipopolysaccharide/colanic/teichoic acid biosynthesis glycosyltransferase